MRGQGFFSINQISEVHLIESLPAVCSAPKNRVKIRANLDKGAYFRMIKSGLLISVDFGKNAFKKKHFTSSIGHFNCQG